MVDPKATMFLFAGNNGSGKSTIRNLIIDRIGISVNIDSDALARRINPLDPERAKISAGKEAIRLARDCIRYAIRLMQEAKLNQFEITMFYIGLRNPRLNIERVATRVRNGGHDIPSEDILHRHHTSMRNLLDHLDLVNYLLIIDNSDSGGEIVLEAENGRLKFQGTTLPDWVLPLKSRLMH